MKKKAGRLATARRDFLIGAAQASAAIGLSQLLPGKYALAQGNVIKGKEKLIVRSVRPEDLETPVACSTPGSRPTTCFTSAITLTRPQ
jgi:hypothetical protein